MKRLTRLVAIMSALAAQACMSSTLLLHVMPDGSGQAVITSRVFESGIRAFDGLFPERPAAAPKLEELLPALSEERCNASSGRGFASSRRSSTRRPTAASGRPLSTSTT